MSREDRKKKKQRLREKKKAINKEKGDGLMRSVSSAEKKLGRLQIYLLIALCIAGIVFLFYNVN